MSYEVQDFQQDVIEASNNVPVLVDFWADWCGPCKALGPVLEKLAGEAQGRWKLVKVNVDQNQELAQAFQIRGIPSCKLVHEGRLLGEFSGALPESQLREWLQQNLPEGLAETPDAPAEPVLAGGLDGAIEQARAALERDPDNADLRTRLASVEVLRAPAQARERVADLNEDYGDFDRVVAIRNLADVLEPAPESWPAGAQRETVLRGLDAIRSGDFAAAAESLVDSLFEDRNYGEQAARRALAGLFNILGREHPVTREYRRRFHMAVH